MSILCNTFFLLKKGIDAYETLWIRTYKNQRVLLWAQNKWNKKNIGKNVRFQMARFCAYFYINSSICKKFYNHVYNSGQRMPLLK